MAEFDKVQELDEPELVAARWWRRSESTDGDGLSRRGALLGLAGLSAVTVLGSNTACVGGGGSALPAIEQKAALELQQKEGWDFGADGAKLVMPGEGTVDPASLHTLADALKPKNAAHQPFARGVLFDSVRQGSAAAGDLAKALKPYHTPEMENAELAGAGLSSLFDGAPPGRAVVVDLPGPEAVAFAAGLANRFDPVFVFDNWPHPKGSVPSHLTLAAAVDRRATFEQMAAARPEKAPPVFVLDANRLATFDGKAFDNRYVAHMPSARALKDLGVSHVILVRPKASDEELDDQNAVVMDWMKNGVGVQLVGADAFKPVPQGADAADYAKAAPGAAPPAGETVGSEVATADTYGTSYRHSSFHHYGGYGSHWFFWPHYGFGTPRYGAVAPSSGFRRSSYKPGFRSTTFSGNKTPSGFGKVNVEKRGSKLGMSSTQSKGAAASRARSGSSGSWGRSGGRGYS
ncbi:MAG: hypothetical protein H6736_08850 [Alphaproteobacteria bacterium]|nr:hypothetical protein [Alphaproteobacteria bacterium]MCB9691910.1 hypothetical protein [Alphaproteobacteria bacterium]